MSAAAEIPPEFDSVDLFRLFAEQFPCTIFLNMGGRVVYVNPHGVEASGYSREEILSESFDFRCLIAPESRELLDANFRYVKRVLPIVPGKGPVTSHDFEELLTATFVQLMSQPDSRDFMNMMVNEASGADPYFSAKVDRFYNELAGMFAAYIKTIQQEGLIEKRDPRIQAYLIMGALKEIFVQWAKGGKFEDLKSLIHEAACFIVNGVSGNQSGQSLEKAKAIHN